MIRRDVDEREATVCENCLANFGDNMCCVGVAYLNKYFNGHSVERSSSEEAL